MAKFDNMNEQEQMQILMSQLQDSNLRQSVMQYINQTANGLDKDANSKALIETLARESVHNQQSTAMWKSRTKKSVAVGVVAVVLAITVQFLVNYFTNELSKESHVDQQGAMVSTAGKVVKTQMEEMKVDADGKLLSRSGDAAVKTMPSLAMVAMSSSLPDATLMALDEITVHSDKGYSLHIKVHGFSRIPVLNSRCGNVVHFYTAWKGKMTLDSTDLSFDEATAAEFKNAGFSLATGGRRLAGKITVDGFAKALDGMRESGKWTCADVPLPSLSELGDRKETSYNQCGTIDDKTSMCYSMYGGLKLGVTALEGSLAAAVTSGTDLLKGRQTKKMFVKSSSAVMNSDLYRVSFSEHAMHPGQQLVAISDLASGKAVQFQMETDKTRSHCVVSNDEIQKTDQQAKKSAKMDSDWHFEYLGTSEEDGRVLRHFRIMLSSEYTRFVFGDATKISLPNFAEFWDVAETMEPQRLVLGTDSITVFDSYKLSVSDLDVESAVKTRTGKSVADLMKCSNVEAAKTTRPEMNLFGELSAEDADYYKASSATKSEVLAHYLDATGNTNAMPDMCYEKCSAAVDAVMKTDTSDICEGAILSSALSCLQETGIAACSASIFSAQHAGECDGADSNDSVRVLEESQDALVLLVNETPTALSTTRELVLLGSGCSKEEKKLLVFKSYVCPGGEQGTCQCVRADFVTKKSKKIGLDSVAKKKMEQIKKDNINSGWYGAAKNKAIEHKFPTDWYMKETDGAGFTLEIGWRKMMGSFALWIKLQFCMSINILFGIPKPLSATFCIGGSIQVGYDSKCPHITGFYIEGKAWMKFDIGLDFWIAKISLMAIELGIEAGVGWMKLEVECWWFAWDGVRRRRRWLWPRRRRNRACNYKEACDVYVKGYLEITITIFRARIELVYWTKNKVLQIILKLYVWFWKWHEAFTRTIYQRKM